MNNLLLANKISTFTLKNKIPTYQPTHLKYLIK